MDSNETIEERMAKLEQAARNLPTFGKPLPPLKPACRRVVSEKKNGGRWTLAHAQGARQEEIEAARSSCPQDTEPMAEKAESGNEKSEMARAVIETPSHQDQVRDFKAPKNQNEVMLVELQRVFDESRPDVPGGWVSNGHLMALGIGRTNNRAIDLRNHKFVIFYGLDVDCVLLANPSGSGAEHWAYRLCKKEQSERLKRAVAAREDRNQTKLATD